MPIRMNTLLSVVLLCLLLCSQSVNAAVINDLYDAKIAVNDQSDRTQNKAFTVALRQVIIKVRGNIDLLSSQKIKSALNKATRFVRSYSYDKQGAQLYLVVSFDPQRVENLIRSAGFPVWDKRRPETIIWLAIKDTEDSVPTLVTQVKYPEVYQELAARAAERGIALVFPLWDLDDIQTLGVYDIWGGFSAQLALASERYTVSSILSARIYLGDKSGNTGQWFADWTMIEGGGLLAGQEQSDTLANIAKALVDRLADQLSSKYAVDLSQVDRANTKVQIVVNNIDSLTYYSLALGALENMSVVSSATLIEQQGARATFELDLLGDVEDLTNALSLDSKIKPVVDNFGQPIKGLEFFWVK